MTTMSAPIPAEEQIIWFLPRVKNPSELGPSKAAVREYNGDEDLTGSYPSLLATCPLYSQY